MIKAVTLSKGLNCHIYKKGVSESSQNKLTLRKAEVLGIVPADTSQMNLI